MSSRDNVHVFMSMAADGDEVVFGDPATDPDIVSLEAELEATFPEEFKEIYRQFNGVRLSCSRHWWLVPLSGIPDLTRDVDEWLVRRIPELVGQCVFFGDWENGDAFGFLKSEMDSEPTIIQFNHETGEVSDTEQTLVVFLELLAEVARRS